MLNFVFCTANLSGYGGGVDSPLFGNAFHLSAVDVILRKNLKLNGCELVFHSLVNYAELAFELCAVCAAAFIPVKNQGVKHEAVAG